MGVLAMSIWHADERAAGGGQGIMSKAASDSGIGDGDRAARKRPPSAPARRGLIEKLVDRCCTTYVRAIKADAPEGPKAMDKYVEARQQLREAIAEYGGKRLIDYLEEQNDGSS